jgi:putative SOS response-associated peptidase YedK
MPVIIPSDKYDLWLDAKVQDSSAFSGVLNPYPSAEMELFPVTPKVNSVKYNSPESIKQRDDTFQNSGD